MCPPMNCAPRCAGGSRELIDFHVDDAVLDVFDAPASGARTTQTHLYVVVSRSNDVKQLADQLQDAGIAWV